MNKIIMATGMMVGLCLSCEFFIAWYSGSPFERFAFINRALRALLVGLLDDGFCNVIIPQVFWFKKCQYQYSRYVRDFSLCEYRNVV